MKEFHILFPQIYFKKEKWDKIIFKKIYEPIGICPGLMHLSHSEMDWDTDKSDENVCSQKLRNSYSINIYKTAKLSTLFFINLT